MEKEIFYIESSQTWTCPKVGRYKIICVGGGASGGLRGSNGYTDQLSGETTSFGTYLYAAGGKKASSAAAQPNADSAGGYGGYNGITYGGQPLIVNNTYKIFTPPTDNGGMFGEAGRGWGAGGGAVAATLTYQYTETTGSASGPTTTTKTGSRATYTCGGFNGDITSTIVNLDVDAQISCTVGEGGAKNGFITADESARVTMLAKALNTTYNSMTDVQIAANIKAMNNAVIAGNDGVIIIQFLGG